MVIEKIVDAAIQVLIGWIMVVKIPVWLKLKGKVSMIVKVIGVLISIEDAWIPTLISVVSLFLYFYIWDGVFFLCFGVIIGGLTFLYCIFALCKRIWDSDVIFEGFGCFSVLVLFIFVCCLLFGSGTSFISTSKSVGHSHYFNMKHIYEDCKYVIAPQKVSDFGALCRGISGSCPICEDRQVREREVEKLQR